MTTLHNILLKLPALTLFRYSWLYSLLVILLWLNSQNIIHVNIRFNPRIQKDLSNTIQSIVVKWLISPRVMEKNSVHIPKLAVIPTKLQAIIVSVHMSVVSVRFSTLFNLFLKIADSASYTSSTQPISVVLLGML